MEILSFEKLTIYEVETLHETLKPLVESLTEDLELDLSSVRKVDMSAIQILIATQKSCQSQNVELILKNVDEVILKDLDLCGCSQLLGVSHE